MYILFSFFSPSLTLYVFLPSELVKEWNDGRVSIPILSPSAFLPETKKLCVCGSSTQVGATSKHGKGSSKRNDVFHISGDEHDAMMIIMTHRSGPLCRITGVDR